MAHRHQERVDSTKKLFFQKRALLVPFDSQTKNFAKFLWNMSQIGPLLVTDATRAPLPLHRLYNITKDMNQGHLHAFLESPSSSLS